MLKLRTSKMQYLPGWFPSHASKDTDCDEAFSSTNPEPRQNASSYEGAVFMHHSRIPVGTHSSSTFEDLSRVVDWFLCKHIRHKGIST